MNDNLYLYLIVSQYKNKFSFVVVVDVFNFFFLPLRFLFFDGPHRPRSNIFWKKRKDLTGVIFQTIPGT